MINTILLVDDELNVLRSLKRLFVRSGFDVATASSAADALEYLSTNRVAVIVTDFRMPVMDGAEFLLEVKQKWPTTVNLVLSGYADFKSVVELLNQGVAFRFLEKPWSDDDLLTNIHQALVEFSKYHFQKTRDQILLGSVSPLIEVTDKGVIGRYNGYAKKVIHNIEQLQGRNVSELSATLKTDVIDAFFAEESPTLFLNYFDVSATGEEKEIIIERYLSDQFAHLLKLSFGGACPKNELRFKKSSLMAEHEFCELVTSFELNSRPCTVVYLGVLQFSLLNNLLNHHEIYSLIHDIVNAIEGALTDEIKLCHFNMDRFVLLIPRIMNDTQLLIYMEKIIKKFNELLCLTRATTDLNFYGVYGFVPEDGISGKELINQMRLNMGHQIVKQHRTITRFDPDLVADYKKEFELSRMLLTAISEEQLTLRFQPKIDLSSQKVAGAEVLVRWYEPKKYGWVSPAQFIPIAECDGQIIELGRWVIEKSCEALSRWMKEGIESCPLAINVSGRQLKEDKGFVDFVLECVKKHHLLSSQLHFELTETYLVEDIAGCQQQLSELRSHGFEILIDDFGVGYSSLAYLSKLAVDALKLDKVLITDLDSSIGMQSLVRNIIRMAHELKLKVIAEGVETPFQCSKLKTLGCDYVQGFYFSVPLEEDDFCAFIQSTNKIITI